MATARGNNAECQWQLAEMLRGLAVNARQEANRYTPSGKNGARVIAWPSLEPG
jgi:hypothetical protein